MFYPSAGHTRCQLPERITIKMATQTIVTLIDSINGSTEDVETVTFFHPMTGVKMTVELDAKNRKAMGTHLERLNKYFEAAEIVAEPVEPSKPKAAKNTETTKIREWARQNGFTIGDRGRISAEIMTAYQAAQEQVETPESGSVMADVVDEIDSRQEQAEIEIEKFDEDNSQTSDEAVETLPTDDDEILALMAQIEAAHGEVTEESLKAALDSNSDNE
jgi:hypothetical protein